MTNWAPNSSPHLLALIDKTHAPFENSILDYRMFFLTLVTSFPRNECINDPGLCTKNKS
jgi:hypothetical protein